jgi:hypothetical protein
MGSASLAHTAGRQCQCRVMSACRLASTTSRYEQVRWGKLEACPRIHTGTKNTPAVACLPHILIHLAILKHQSDAPACTVPVSNASVLAQSYIALLLCHPPAPRSTTCQAPMRHVCCTVCGEQSACCSAMREQVTSCTPGDATLTSSAQSVYVLGATLCSHRALPACHAFLPFHAILGCYFCLFDHIVLLTCADYYYSLLCRCG